MAGRKTIQMITAERLFTLCPNADGAVLREAAPVLDALREAYQADRALRVAHLVGQLAHESGGFMRMVENLNYSAERIPQVWPKLTARAGDLAHKPQPLGNAAYASVLGNGDEASGDGWRFRGRGLIQLTGRTNYTMRGRALGIDLAANPDLAADPGVSALLALSFWSSRGCGLAADRDDVPAVTQLINGLAMQGLQERRQLTTKAKTIFI